MTTNDIVATVTDDFAAVDTLIRKQLSSNVPFISKVGDYIVSNGGKRIRPLISLLCAKACQYEGEAHLTIAAVVEFLHTATLLHDDVVDGSELRRGKATVNAVWGNSPSILVGDFLISRAFQMVVSLQNLPVLEVLSNATNLIAEGEVLQLLNCRNPDTTEEQYYEVIRLKTAKMFEAAAECGALVTGTGPEIVKAVAQYALHLGNAFQLIDDILDYTGDPKAMGKNVGDDLAEGKPTLPLIYTLQHAEPAAAQKIKSLILASKPLDNLEQTAAEIIAIATHCGAIDYVKRQAIQESQSAIQQLALLPASKYRDALEALANQAVSRAH